MEKTGKPIAGGVINIVAGSLNILGFIGVIIAMAVYPTYWTVSNGYWAGSELWVDTFMLTFLWIAAVVSLILGVLPIIGGIYALQRKKWGLALAGSIAAIFGFTPLGIAATVLVAISKDEFE